VLSALTRLLGLLAWLLVRLAALLAALVALLVLLAGLLILVLIVHVNSLCWNDIRHMGSASGLATRFFFLLLGTFFGWNFARAAALARDRTCRFDPRYLCRLLINRPRALGHEHGREN
jgi:hypothetical protein